MELKKIIKLLEELPDESGLEDDVCWDEDKETTEWRNDVIIALREAVDILKSKDEQVGNLSINGKSYRIIE